MCGILFAIAKTLPFDHSVQVRAKNAIQSLRHRGPDAQVVNINEERTVVTGHARLSVLDLSTKANQPFFDTETGDQIVFNGEIYNYLELQETSLGGLPVKTSTDTEVLLRLISNDGPEAIPLLNGMFAFVHAHVSEKSFLIARDRFGIKPLYYYEDSKQFVAASEIKAICAFCAQIPAPNLDAIGAYIKYGAAGEIPETWFQNVKRLPPGTYMTLSREANGLRISKPVSYYQRPSSTKQTKPYLDTRRKFQKIFLDAVKIRMRSDVPVGLSLSGGLDSATIAATVRNASEQKLEAFTAYFEPRETSEIDLATEVAENFQHRLNDVLLPSDCERIFEVLTKCVYHLESGHSSPAIVPYFLLCAKASKNITVMLEGQGADELLAGYDISKLSYLPQLLISGRFKAAYNVAKFYVQANSIQSFFLNLLRINVPFLYRHQHLRWNRPHILSPAVRDASRPTELASGISLDKTLRSSHERGLVNLLHYGDAISMAHSLESRLPFMDFRLVDFCFSANENVKIDAQSGFGKRILRDSAVNWGVPENICFDPVKKGFVSPVAKILKAAKAINMVDVDVRRQAADKGVFETVLSHKELRHLPDHIYFRVLSIYLWMQHFG